MEQGRPQLANVLLFVGGPPTSMLTPDGDAFTKPDALLPAPSTVTPPATATATPTQSPPPPPTATPSATPSSTSRHTATKNAATATPTKSPTPAANFPPPARLPHSSVTASFGPNMPALYSDSASAVSNGNQTFGGNKQQGDRVADSD